MHRTREGRFSGLIDLRERYSATRFRLIVISSLAVRRQAGNGLPNLFAQWIDSRSMRVC
jgi:hypothetical protein